MRVVKKLIRDASLLSVIIAGLLVLFFLQTLLSARFTGHVIQVGKPDEVVIVEQPKPQPIPQPIVVDPKLKCWLGRGVQQEDLAVIGNLLQQAPCDTSLERKTITAQVTTDCVDVRVADQATTKICVHNTVPSFTIDLPAGSGPSLGAPKVGQDYWMAIFIFLIGILLLMVWGRTDLQYYHYRRRATKNYTNLLPGREEVEIRYITPPPLYKKPLEASKEVIHARAQQPAAVKQQPLQQPRTAEQQKVLTSPLNKQLIAFNTLSQHLCDLLAEKKFTEAEQQYPALYTIALDLYSLVSEENKVRLLRVVTALHQQLKNVRKAYGVAQEVKQVYQYEQHKETYQPKVWQPAPLTLKREQIHHLDEELTKLRHLLEGSKHQQAVRHFRKFWH